jgi:glycosyltransferase involved in cell wall biosynthesis
MGVVRRFFQSAYLAETARRESVTHLHAHFATAPALMAMLAHRLTGIPYSFTAHARDIYVDTASRQLINEMRDAKAVITVSDYNREHLSRMLGPGAAGKVRRVYNGLNLQRFPFRSPNLLRQGPAAVLSVGRLVEKKGFEDLITAVGLLTERGCDLYLRIIGSGPLEPKLRQMIDDRRLGDRVVLLGAQAHDIVLQELRRADLFVLPCRIGGDGDRDGIPTVLLEAMAAGVPAVSTPISGIPELIETGVTGHLVPATDPDALADGIKMVLGDPELRYRFTMAARSAIEDRFKVDAATEQLLDLFGESA